MKQNESMVKTVSGGIDTIVSATENILRNIAGLMVFSLYDGIPGRGKTAYAYDRGRTISGKVEGIVLGFFK
jgi:hypothetical protein